MSENKKVTIKDAWYTAKGPEDDVILSSRVRLARNLANFLFPSFSSQTESDRVESLVFGSFSTMDDPDSYQAISVNDLEYEGRQIFVERGVLHANIPQNQSVGMVIRTDGRFACTVNYIDHVRLSAFASGLDLQSAYEICKNVDEKLQKTLQFAASFDFGYLNSMVGDTGTGMKVSVRIHLPSLARSGTFKDIVSIIPDGYSLFPCYDSPSKKDEALGCCYELCSQQCFPDSEYDQIDNLTAIVLHIAEMERKSRREFADKKSTILRDFVNKAYAQAKFSRMLTCREAISILSDIKWGVDSGVLSGVDDNVLSSLLYRIQPAHLGFVIKTGDFCYESDISTEGLRINRLRSLVIQEALEKVMIE